MDFDLGADLEAFRASARSFAEREIAPLVDQAEAEERTPLQIFRRAGEAGFLGIRYPAAVGGQDATVLAETILREELAKVCSGIAAAISVSSHLGTYPIHAFGSPEQQDTYLAPALRGDSISAFALTEPGAGSDVRGIKTRGEPSAGGWKLTGRKTFITNGTIADFMIVVAVTEPSLGIDGFGLFIVDLPSKKVEITRIKKMGHLSSEIAEVALDGVEVAEEACLGGPRGAWKRVMETLGIGRVVVSGGAIGIATAALEEAVNYAREREAFGRPIGHNQGISFPLAESYAEIEAARLAVYRAAWLIDEGRDALKEVSAAKLVASETCLRVTDRALRTFGGYGYMREYPIERLYRDARYFVIVEGTSEIQKRVLAKRLGVV